MEGRVPQKIVTAFKPPADPEGYSLDDLWQLVINFMHPYAP